MSLYVFQIKIRTGASGSMRITGLPFTSRNVPENQAAVPMMHKLTISDKYVTGYIAGNSTSIDFYKQPKQYSLVSYPN
jgi:hypothetical protein